MYFHIKTLLIQLLSTRVRIIVNSTSLPDSKNITIWVYCRWNTYRVTELFLNQGRVFKNPYFSYSCVFLIIETIDVDITFWIFAYRRYVDPIIYCLNNHKILWLENFSHRRMEIKITENIEIILSYYITLYTRKKIT